MRIRNITVFQGKYRHTRIYRCRRRRDRITSRWLRVMSGKKYFPNEIVFSSIFGIYKTYISHNRRRTLYSRITYIVFVLMRYTFLMVSLIELVMEFSKNFKTRVSLDYA